MAIKEGNYALVEKRSEEGIYDMVRVFGVTEDRFDMDEKYVAYVREKPASSQYGVRNIEHFKDLSEINPRGAEVQLFRDTIWYKLKEILLNKKGEYVYKLDSSGAVYDISADVSEVNHFRF